MIASRKPRTVMKVVVALGVYPTAALAAWFGFDLTKAITRCWECVGTEKKTLTVALPEAPSSWHL